MTATRAALACLLLLGTCRAWAQDPPSGGALPASRHEHPEDAGAGEAPLTMSLPACVAEALRIDPRIEEAQAKVAEHEATLAEVESVFYPKLQAIAWVAPMFTVTGSALDKDVKRDFGWSSWGPYTHLKATLAQPLYTFGRAAAGERAATARVRVEQARVREAEHRVALEVVRMYATHLFARTMLRALDQGARILAEAEEKGQEAYARGDGSVTRTDLMRLRYGALEIEKHRLAARDGQDLSLAALKRLVGRGQAQALALADADLPAPLATEPPALDVLVAEATRSRPEWTQIAEGEKATAALEQAEKRANLPVLFLGGELSFDWAPTRSDTPNPYHYDPYNDLVGGVAVGLLFDLDVAKSLAKADKARALGMQVTALKRLAASGIPLEVRKARDDLVRYRAVVDLSRQSEKAAKQWMTSAAAGYMTGVGEARDLLEGVVAWLMARRDLYQGLLDVLVARGELLRTVGRVPGLDDLPTVAPTTE